MVLSETCLCGYFRFLDTVLGLFLQHSLFFKPIGSELENSSSFRKNRYYSISKHFHRNIFQLDFEIGGELQYKKAAPHLIDPKSESNIFLDCPFKRTEISDRVHKYSGRFSILESLIRRRGNAQMTRLGEKNLS